MITPRPRQFLPLLLAALGLSFSGCSTIKRAAINQVGNALAGGGTTFASDDDPDFIKAASPFSLKLMESLLAESPRHAGLLLATASGFTQYAYAFVHEDADELEETNFTAATAMHARARRLYLRARDYGLRGLDVAHAGMSAALRNNPRAAVAVATKDDVPLLYWTAAAWGSAISLSKDNPDLIGDLPIVEALIDRALALDETFNAGAIHGFLIAYEPSRPTGEGDPFERARKHFERAVALSGGTQAGPFVSLAESVDVPNQNVAEFRVLLARALAINPDANPDTRLVNLVMQRRARWLLAHTEDLFLIADPK
jgi:predicted anti-sigma-YlaC factor YlaD